MDDRALTALRLAGLCAAVLAVHWLADTLMNGTRSGGVRLIIALCTMPVALIGSALLLLRWRYSLPAIALALLGLTAVDTTLFRVVQYGPGWLSFADVLLGTLFRALQAAIFVIPVLLMVLVARRAKGSSPN